MNKLITSVGFCMAFALAGCEEKPKETTSPPETICGTIKGLMCADGQYCDIGVGQCNVTDAQGTCKPKPSVCTRDYKPVCGCDGKTYGNECEAAAAGVSIDHGGECATPAPSR